MPYLIKQKIKVIAGARAPQRTVLISLVDPILYRLYARHLEDEFNVVASVGLKDLEQHIRTHSPHLIIIDADMRGFSPVALVRISNLYPEVRILTTGFSVNESDLSSFMAAGVSGHINRSLSHPRDLPVLVKQALGLKE